jgi:hypothetical protein
MHCLVTAGVLGHPDKTSFLPAFLRHLFPVFNAKIRAITYDTPEK